MQIKTKLPSIHIPTKDDICVAIRYTWCYGTELSLSLSMKNMKNDRPVIPILQGDKVLLIERFSNGSSIVLIKEGMIVSIINGDFGYVE